MKPSKASKAGQAYERGFLAAQNHLAKDSNPYKLSSVIHLKCWWDKGFDDYQHPANDKN